MEKHDVTAMWNGSSKNWKKWSEGCEQKMGEGATNWNILGYMCFEIGWNLTL